MMKSCKLILTFQSVEEEKKKKTSLAVISHAAICFSACYKLLEFRNFATFGKCEGYDDMC